MSSSGALRARLEAERREKLRLEQVRSECNNLIKIIKSKTNEVQSDSSVSSVMSGMTNLINSRIGSLQDAVQSAPDQTLSSLKTLSNEVNNFIVQSVSPQRKWVKEQEETYKKLLNFKDEVKSFEAKDKNKINEYLEKISNLETISVDKKVIDETISSITTEFNELKEKEMKENERREIVKQILSVLKSQGFITRKPLLKSEGVELVGKLPSGKGVIFHVQEDARITYDFDGYEGTTCKTELEGLVTKLSTESGVETSIEQFTWHNPDKIEKGAKDLPFNPAQQNYMRKS